MKCWGRLCGVAMIAFTQVVWPCGPDFPTGYVWQGSGEAMFDLPRTNFDLELTRYVGEPIPDLRSRDGALDWEDDILFVDLRELEVVLADAGLDAPELIETLSDYENLRLQYYRKPGPGAEGPAPVFSTSMLEENLPAEFALYVEGARLFHGRDYIGATAAWDALLALPPEERCHRSVWAAFMLGRTWTQRDAEIAPRYFERAIALADEGYDDTLNLAAASYEELGRMDETSKNYVAVIPHYLGHLARCNAGERKSTFYALHRACNNMLDDRSFDLSTVRDGASLNVLALWVNSHRSGGYRWMKALKTITPSREIQGAERIACAAYYAGDMEMAQDWLQYADKKNPHGQWLRAKLLARAGKMKEAEKILDSLAGKFPTDYTWGEPSPYSVVDPNQLIQGELGVCRLNRGAYTQALEAFLRGGYNEDAAYVADRVLRSDELKGFVKKEASNPMMQSIAYIRYGREGSTQTSNVSYLLGRRLAREGHLKEAKTYFPSILTDIGGDHWGSRNEKPIDIQAYAGELNELLQRGADGSRTATERGEDLMEAAQITRRMGLEIYGTELAPDMNIYLGEFEFTVEPRVNSRWATADEKRRVAASAPKPDRRFHYRWKAADLMWKAARLLPDNDERTARALWQGGMYIESKDPKGADKFYKALVRRCRALPIGREADRLHWFPR